MNTIERALYRGQDTVTGEWRFGFYCSIDNTHYIMPVERYSIVEVLERHGIEVGNA